MRKVFFAASLAAFWKLSAVDGADPTCSTGIRHPDPSNQSCCASFCGDSCGAVDCGDKSVGSCCGSAIISENKSCDSNDPPCVVNVSDSNGNRTCSGIGGILADDGSTCCLGTCGTCGGTGCDARTGGIDGCCTSSIKSANKSCNTNSPPCIKQSTSTCTSKGGLLASDSISCCPESCGSCGGYGCDSRPGGKENCCVSSIQTASKSCDSNSPPCTMDTTTTTTRYCSTIGGILAEDGNTCCANSCGTCGGYGCDTRPGGKSSCCISEIISNNISCDTNDPPCLKSTTSSSTGSVQREVEVGIFTGSTSPKQREDDFGMEVWSYRLIFMSIFDLQFYKIEDVFNDGYTPILNMEFLSSSSTPVLQKIIDGIYDDELWKFATECTDYGKTFWIRTLHEYNGDWYPWGILYWYEGKQSNTMDQYKQALNKIIGIFKTKGAPVKFQLDINNVNGLDDTTPLSYFWPGDENIDAVTITAYNRAYSTPNHQYSWSFYKHFQPAYDAISKLTSKPIWVAETATTSYGTDKSTWIRECFRSIALDFPRITQVTWFLYNKDEEGMLLDWDLNTDEQKQAFKDGFLELKELTS
eukprot:CAMPEP_0171460858 /NCGR_PEP_ID=MMETSP0945-20130129/5560_1 /TAXON_ID=109269 /ORGANISM="Vaucheria litorea, Strain CCMP2940" /LENGTH=583 /DNA_ID=CAMNT_0011987133 /DNA_START=94 /DNA_END=1845 /DNA_ORIENTATION=+